MALTMNDKVLTEAFGANEGTALRIKQAVMVVLGIVAIWIAAKVQVFLPGNPVETGKRLPVSRPVRHRVLSLSYYPFLTLVFNT